MGLLGILVGSAFSSRWLTGAGASCCWRPPPRSSPLDSRREPLLAHWTQTFMASAAHFVMQFFPIFLLGALFGKLMEDSGSVTAIATFMTENLGASAPSSRWFSPARWSPTAASASSSLFSCSRRWRMRCFAPQRSRSRLMPAAIALGTSTFTMSMLPGTPAIQNAIPMPFFGTTPFAAPGLGVIAS